MSRRIVADTNVVVSALVFEHGRLTWLRHAWTVGDCRPLISRATAAEIVRVLAYPKFALAADEVEALLGDFLPFTELVAVEPASHEWPGLGDPDDRIFLDLALTGRAEFLVTGDRALLTTAVPSAFRIVTPEQFRSILQG